MPAPQSAGTTPGASSRDRQSGGPIPRKPEKEASREARTGERTQLLQQPFRPRLCNLRANPWHEIVQPILSLTMTLVASRRRATHSAPPPWLPPLSQADTEGSQQDHHNRGSHAVYARMRAFQSSIHTQSSLHGEQSSLKSNLHGTTATNSCCRSERRLNLSH